MTNLMRLGSAVLGAQVLLTASATGQVLNQSLKLRADDAAAGHRFGSSIAIGGGVVAIGAAGDDVNGDSSGSAYLFAVSTGTQLTKLLPDDGAQSDYFGVSIAVSNGVVGVGASRPGDSRHQGSVYLFDLSTGAQLDKLLPDDNTGGKRFGGSLAIADEIVAVGASGDNANGVDSGAAYLFDAQTGEQLAKLLPDDGAQSDRFGASVAIADGIVAVGAWGNDDQGVDSGSVYLFDVATGIQLAKLLPDDGSGGDHFGLSVAMADGVIAVGSLTQGDHRINDGSVYVFDALTGAQLHKFISDDGPDDPEPGLVGDLFGVSVAVSDGIVVAGAVAQNDNGNNSGSAYIFNSVVGEQLAKLLPDDGAEGDLFGDSGSVAVDGAVVAIGADSDDDGGPNSGSVYLFSNFLPCSPGDLATPYGVLDFSDAVTFLTAFGGMDPSADLAEPTGVYDISDVFAFLVAFGAGCP